MELGDQSVELHAFRNCLVHGSTLMLVFENKTMFLIFSREHPYSVMEGEHSPIFEPCTSSSRLHRLEVVLVHLVF